MKILNLRKIASIILLLFFIVQSKNVFAMQGDKTEGRRYQDICLVMTWGGVVGTELLFSNNLYAANPWVQGSIRALFWTGALISTLCCEQSELKLAI